MDLTLPVVIMREDENKLMEFAEAISSVQFSRSVMSDSLRPHESQHARPPCLSPTPGAHSDSRPSSPWCHPAISSSVVPFSSCPQSLPASKSFPMSQLFAWGGQSTGVSALASFLPKKSQGWSSGWTGWILLQSETEKKRFSLRFSRCVSTDYLLPFNLFHWVMELTSELTVLLNIKHCSRCWIMMVNKMSDSCLQRAYDLIKRKAKTKHKYIHWGQGH